MVSPIKIAHLLIIMTAIFAMIICSPVVAQQVPLSEVGGEAAPAPTNLVEVLAPPQAAEFVPVISTIVEAVKYEPADGKLSIKFRDGQFVSHQGVPPELHQQFVESRTMGGFYKGRIERSFPVLERSGPPKDTMTPDTGEEEGAGESDATATGADRTRLGQELDRLLKSTRAAGGPLSKAETQARIAKLPALEASIQSASKELVDVERFVNDANKAFAADATGQEIEKTLLTDIEPRLKKITAALAVGIQGSIDEEVRLTTEKAVKDAVDAVKRMDRDAQNALKAAGRVRRAGN